MPLNDVDLVSRRLSFALPTDQVDLIVYSYDEDTFETRHFKSADDLINLFETQTEDRKSYWIEVINRSSVELPNTLKIFCEYFNIHPLTIENITTLAPNMKLDLFNDLSAVYLLIKTISWNGQRVEQQQISLFLKTSKNILITFQEQTNSHEQVFDDIRDRLRRQRVANGEQAPYHPHTRLKQMNVDYLFHCLLGAIIERYMLVLEDIAVRIDEFDKKLMADKQSLSHSTLYGIYRLKHDLLHLRILFNPLREIIFRLQRTTHDEQVLVRRTDRVRRLDLKHRIIRRQVKSLNRSPHTSNSLLNTTMNTTNNCSKKVKKTSNIFHEHVYIYLSDLNDHINQLIDHVEIQRESVSMLVSFWITLNNNEVEATLKFLMLISVLFMPSILLTGICSMNFQEQPPLQFNSGYFILLGVLAAILVSMITWYKVKRWI